MIYEIAVLVSRFPFSMAARSRLGLIKPTDKIITQKNIYLFQFNNYGSSLFDFNFPVRLYKVGDRQAGSQPARTGIWIWFSDEGRGGESDLPGYTTVPYSPPVPVLFLSVHTRRYYRRVSGASNTSSTSTTVTL